jgi:hypothetical protein
MSDSNHTIPDENAQVHNDDNLIDEDYARSMMAMVDRDDAASPTDMPTLPETEPENEQGWTSPTRRLTPEDTCPPDNKSSRPLMQLVKGSLPSKPIHPYEEWGTARSLMAKEIPPLTWIVPEILSPGLAILAGAPKIGKSWLGLDFSLAVARGGAALGSFPCDGGMVIYIALEDSERRLQSRLNDIYPDSVELPITWRYHLAAPPMPHLLKWLEAQVLSWRPCRLIILDTYGRVSEDKGRAAGYKSDYQETAALQAFALRHDLCLLLIHHTRKAPSSDPFDMISGTFGVTGAADTVMVLDAKPGEPNATLHIRGRDVEYRALSLNFDGGRWRYQGPASVVKHTEEEQEILNLLASDPCGKTAQQLGQVLPVTKDALRQRLVRMRNRGLVDVGEDRHWKIKSQ